VGDLVRFLDAYASFITTSGVAVGITRTDLAATPARQAYVDVLARRGLRCPVFAVDARDHRDVSLLLQSLLYCLDPEASPT
jgi:signal recognition particle receptor subunit beta